MNHEHRNGYSDLTDEQIARLTTLAIASCERHGHYNRAGGEIIAYALTHYGTRPRPSAVGLVIAKAKIERQRDSVTPFNDRTMKGV